MLISKGLLKNLGENISRPDNYSQKISLISLDLKK